MPKFYATVSVEGWERFVFEADSAAQAYEIAQGLFEARDWTAIKDSMDYELEFVRDENNNDVPGSHRAPTVKEQT
jgi:hypothetical protein